MPTAKKTRRSDNVGYQVFRKVAFVSSSLPGRFLTKVAIQSDGCWIWTACTHKNLLYPVHEYGYFCPDPSAIARRTIPAHRFSWESHYGAIPEGLEVDHICRVKLCVNPEHLQLLTHQDNCRRRLKSGPDGGYHLELVNGKRKMVRP